MLLKATERNWGLIGPGTWEKRTWKINSDGTYTLKITYRPLDGEDLSLEQTEEGAFFEEQMEILKECIEEYWSEDPGDPDEDGTAWEFKLYENDAVIRHRDLGYIDGVEPYESIAGLLETALEEEE